jgi:hypothetical protein
MVALSIRRLLDRYIHISASWSKWMICSPIAVENSARLPCDPPPLFLWYTVKWNCDPSRLLNNHLNFITILDLIFGFNLIPHNGKRALVPYSMIPLIAQ